MRRRKLLRVIGVGVTLTLAGCGDGGSGEGSPASTPTDGTPESTQTDAPPTPTATPEPTVTPTRTPQTTPTPSGVTRVVDVGEGGFRFDPESFEIRTGETVRWVWRSSNHNLVPNSIPDGSDWSGTDGGSGATYDEGHEHEFEFTTPGSYTYYCAPHRSAGMTGSFDVVE